MDTFAAVTLVPSTISLDASPLDFTRGSFGVRNRVHLESRCNQCGFKIVGKLDEQEQEHTRNCGGARPE